MVTKVPFLNTKTDLVFIEIRIEGMDLAFAAIVDTGAEVSVVDTNVKSEDVSIYLRGAALFGASDKIMSKTAQVKFYINTLDGIIGPFTENFMPCDIIDSYESDDVNFLPVVMIIGGDFLKRHKAHIDYDARLITME